VYLSAARQRIEDLEQMLLRDLNDGGNDRDTGWDAESLREEAKRMGLSTMPSLAQPID
jgi:hypothetical protein